jgi:hypothetical protein
LNNVETNSTSQPISTPELTSYIRVYALFQLGNFNRKKMAKIFLPLLILIGAIFQNCSDDDLSDSPDLSSCDCPGFQMNIVCGEDGRTYLDSCFAECLQLPIIQSGSCPDAFNDPTDTLKWAIEFICIPIIKEGDPMEIRTLADGSILYQNEDGSFFRGTPNLCRCLPADALIATPNGAKKISSLSIGDQVWSLDEYGQRISQPIKYLRKVATPDDHKLVHLFLDDDRWIKASPMHPDATGRTMSSLNISDCLDGAIIIHKKWEVYKEAFTWDLLPDGDTGLYFANDILMGSTIRVNG